MEKEEINMFKKYAAVITAAALALSAAACSTQALAETTGTEKAAVSVVETTEAEKAAVSVAETLAEETLTEETPAAEEAESTDLFSERDLRQNVDLSEAVYYTAESNSTVTITEAGIYVFSGTAENYSIIVEADDEAKVQLVLSDLSVENTNSPVIYVKNADKTFVTTEEGTENTLSVTGSFTADGTTNTDAVIFSKDDLVLNGLGTLNISSTDNGITCKDDLKLTGGTLNITCSADALEANESILIADGVITVRSGKDGLHAEYDEDNTVGSVYICGGTLNITASDDAIHATTTCQVDGGDLILSAAEGIEATVVQLNGGNIDVTASDDGINAGQKSTALSVAIEINGGELTINMGQGDTDGIDSNGSLTINDGTISINAQSPFDADGACSYNGGTIIVNGTVTNQIQNQMMGGGMMGGPQGSMGGQKGAQGPASGNAGPGAQGGPGMSGPQGNFGGMRR